MRSKVPQLHPKNIQYHKVLLKIDNKGTDLLYLNSWNNQVRQELLGKKKYYRPHVDRQTALRRVQGGFQPSIHLGCNTESSPQRQCAVRQKHDLWSVRKHRVHPGSSWYKTGFLLTRVHHHGNKYCSPYMLCLWELAWQTFCFRLCTFPPHSMNQSQWWWWLDEYTPYGRFKHDTEIRSDTVLYFEITLLWLFDFDWLNRNKW